MNRAKTIHELRSEVKANDKFIAAAKPEAEAVKHIVENYRTTNDCALAFVRWLKGGPPNEPSQPNAKNGQVLETWHKAGDETGEHLLTDAESAGRRVKKGKKK